MITEEFEEILTLLVSQTFKVGNTLGVDIQRFIAGGLREYKMDAFSVIVSVAGFGSDSQVAHKPPGGPTLHLFFCLLHLLLLPSPS